MPSSRDRKTSSVEQNLDEEPPWDGRESAGPDDKGHNSAILDREWSNCRRPGYLPNCAWFASALSNAHGFGARPPDQSCTGIHITRTCIGNGHASFSDD